MPERLILVVDDEENQRKVLAGFLRKRGFDVETAATTDAACTVSARGRSTWC
jgi:CheY-like chemotaxis protein